MTARRIGSAAAYIAAIVAANWLTAHFGLWPVGFGLVATAGTYAAGSAFVARNAVQDTSGRTAAIVAIFAGAALSAWLSTPELAVASAGAFLVAEGLDMSVYTPLRRRGWVRAAAPANVVGATVDTTAFIALVIWTHAIPHFGWSWTGFLGQWIGKLWITWATVLAVLVVRAIGKRRAVLRDRVRPEGA